MFKACEIHEFYNTAFIKPVLYYVCPQASPETLSQLRILLCYGTYVVKTGNSSSKTSPHLVIS